MQNEKVHPLSTLQKTTSDEVKMRYYDVFDSDEFDEDLDDQDGTHFKDYEPPYEDYYSNDKTLIDIYEENDFRTLLFIRAHYDELINDEAYRKAYFRLLNEMIRKASYFVNEPIGTISDEDRESQESALDFLISIEGRKKIETYKNNAIYIVDLINSGKV